MTNKSVVVNLLDNYYPYAEYPENAIRHSDSRLATFIARELWETRKRLHEDTTHPETWDVRHVDDIKTDINTILELLNRGIIR